VELYDEEKLGQRWEVVEVRSLRVRLITSGGPHTSSLPEAGGREETS